MFKFDFKHGHIKIVPQIFVENWKSYFVLTVFASRTSFSPVSVWKNYSSFSKLMAQKSVKDSMFVG